MLSLYEALELCPLSCIEFRSPQQPLVMSSGHGHTFSWSGGQNEPEANK